MEIRLVKYDHYKDSGIEWLGEIPEHWTIMPGLNFLYENKDRNKGLVRSKVLSLSYGNIRVKLDNELTGLVPESFETYQFVNKGDLIFRPTDLQNDTVSLRSSISEDNGIITNAYLNLRFRSLANSKFYHYFFRAIDNNKIIYGLGSGLRQNISYLDFRRFGFPFPPLAEQVGIARFLDEKIMKIDQAIVQKQQQISLLKERRQILVHNAITKGIKADTKLKESGVELIGKIPESWELMRLKDVCSINLTSLEENTKKSLKIKYVDIGSVSAEDGIVNTEEYEFKFAPSRARRVAKKGDTIISTVRTYLKAVDFIDDVKSTYIYSTGFAILTPKAVIHPRYLAYFVGNDAFTNQVKINSKGMSYPAITSADIGRLLITHCEIEEQTKIVNYIEIATIKSAKAIVQKQKEIEKLREYKTSLINSTVTGKVKVC